MYSNGFAANVIDLDAIAAVELTWDGLAEPSAVPHPLAPTVVTVAILSSTVTSGNKPILVVAAAMGIIGAAALVALAAAPAATEDPRPRARNPEPQEPRLRTLSGPGEEGAAGATPAVVAAVGEVNSHLETARRLLAKDRASLDAMDAQGELTMADEIHRLAAQIAETYAIPLHRRRAL